MENEFIVDISRPPIGPPNISVSEWGIESKESKKRTLGWSKYIDDYSRALEAKSQHISHAT